MVGHRVYRTIAEAIKAGKLEEPFSSYDLIKACPNLNRNTCVVFLSKHRRNNPSKTSELFEMDSDGRFRLIRPLKYGM